jgi:hypothetical protein
LARPAGGYKLADGTSVPGASTIVGVLGDANALARWAWRLGKDGKNYDDVMNAAAASGTLAHDKVEAAIRGQPIPEGTGAVETEAANSLKAFDKWRVTKAGLVLPLEVPLVSEQYRYGGTPDALYMEVDGWFFLVDWKSGRVWNKHFAQMGAYSLLLREERGLHVHGVVIVHIDKKTGKPREYPLNREQLDLAENLFLACLDVYHREEQFNRSVK